MSHRNNIKVLRSIELDDRPTIAYLPILLPVNMIDNIESMLFRCNRRKHPDDHNITYKCQAILYGIPESRDALLRFVEIMLDIYKSYLHERIRIEIKHHILLYGTKCKTARYKKLTNDMAALTVAM